MSFFFKYIMSILLTKADEALKLWKMMVYINWLIFHDHFHGFKASSALVNNIDRIYLKKKLNDVCFLLGFIRVGWF